MPLKRCHYCGTVLTRSNRTRDHIVPQARGGLDRGWNVVWSCTRCNADKGMAWPTCKCDRCWNALLRWRAGERVIVMRYTDDALLPPIRFCSAACVERGCPGGACRWPNG